MRILRTLFSLLMCSAISVAAGEPLALIVHPSNPVKTISKAEAASLLRGDTLFVGGKKVSLILGKPSTRSLPAVTYGLLYTSPSGLLGLIKQTKMRGVTFDPEFLDTPEAVEAKVAANPSAIAIMLVSEIKGSGVKVIPIAE